MIGINVIDAMRFYQRYRIFQKTVTGLLFLFFGIMAAVVYMAYLRPSGAAGIDAARIQKMRFEAYNEKN